MRRGRGSQTEDREHGGSEAGARPVGVYREGEAEGWPGAGGDSLERNADTEGWITKGLDGPS